MPIRTGYALVPCGAAGALFGGDGFDDEFAGLGGVEGFGGKLEGLGDEVLHGGRVEEGRGFEDDVAGFVAAAGEESFGVAEAGAALQEEETDPAGKEGDGEDGVGGAVGGGEADGEGVVVVVDELDGAGEAGAHFAEGGAGLGGDFGREFVEEDVELGGGGYFWGRLFVWSGFFLRGCGLARRHGGNGSTAGEQPQILRLRACGALLRMTKAKSPLRGAGFLLTNYAGDHLISHTLTRAVPSAQRGLTSVFGMGTGGTLAVNSPANCRTIAKRSFTTE